MMYQRNDHIRGMERGYIYANRPPDFVTPIPIPIIVPLRLRLVLAVPDVDGRNDDVAFRHARFGGRVHAADGAFVVDGSRAVGVAGSCAGGPDCDDTVVSLEEEGRGGGSRGGEIRTNLL